MEVVQRYTVDFHNALNRFIYYPQYWTNCNSPYWTNTNNHDLDGDLPMKLKGQLLMLPKNYDKNNYGILSGRKIEDLIHNTRTLDGQSDKKNPQDFALWKRAEPQHIVRWPSPWGIGFPGWHLECTAMSNIWVKNLIFMEAVWISSPWMWNCSNWNMK